MRGADLGAVDFLTLSGNTLRRVELAYATFNAVEWATWIAMIVYAYEQGGETTAGLVALAQLIPAAVFAPIGASATDRFRPGRVLLVTYVVLGVTCAATAWPWWTAVRRCWSTRSARCPPRF